MAYPLPAPARATGIVYQNVLTLEVVLRREYEGVVSALSVPGATASIKLWDEDRLTPWGEFDVELQSDNETFECTYFIPPDTEYPETLQSDFFVTWPGGRKQCLFPMPITVSGTPGSGGLTARVNRYYENDGDENPVGIASAFGGYRSFAVRPGGAPTLAPTYEVDYYIKDLDTYETRRSSGNWNFLGLVADYPGEVPTYQAAGYVVGSTLRVANVWGGGSNLGVINPNALAVGRSFTVVDSFAAGAAQLGDEWAFGTTWAETETFVGGGGGNKNVDQPGFDLVETKTFVGGGGTAMPANVLLYLNFEGTNGSLVLVDQSLANKTPSSVSAPGISTVRARFGSSSFAGGCVYTNAYPTQFSGATAFTFQCWLWRPTGTPLAQVSIAKFGNEATGRVVMYWNANENRIALEQFGVGFRHKTTIDTPQGDWFHFAWTRSTGSLSRFWVNGTLAGSLASYSQVVGNNSKLEIYSMTGNPGQCYMDQFRLETGEAYTADFTPVNLGD